MDSDKMTTFFAERVDWDAQQNAAKDQKIKFWKYFGISGWSMAALAIAAVIPLTVLHKFVPIIVTVDKLAGQKEVQVGRVTIDVMDKEKEPMMIADLGNYVKAREGFTRGEAEANYKTVWYSSSEDIIGAFDAEFKPELNPRSLVSVMKPSDQIKLVNMSVQFFPTDDDKFRMAQVRYDKERRIGSNAATTQRMVSTVTFTYDAARIPKTVEGLMFNPTGFVVKNFRTDEESKERPITVGGTPQGVFSAAPGGR